MSQAEWKKAQPAVKFPDAEKNALTVRDVIVHTPRAADAAKYKEAATARPPRD